MFLSKNKIYLSLPLAAGLILSQVQASGGATSKGHTASELEHPQNWGEGFAETAASQENTAGAQSVSPPEQPSEHARARPQGSASEPGGELPEHTIGASESMDKLFPMGIPTPEKNQFLGEIKIWIHELGGESHQRQNAVERLSEAGTRVVPYLLQALKDPYPYTRVGALTALANIRDKSVIPSIERLLGDRSYEVRAEAAKSLGIMKNKESLPKLVVCLEDREFRVRREAVIALGKLKTENARDALLGALQTTTHTDVRQQAVQELPSFSGPQVVEALLQSTHGQDQKLCIFAIRSLGEVGDSAARPRLVELSHNRDRAIREEALNALEELE